MNGVQKGLKSFWELRKRDDWKSMIFWLPVIVLIIKLLVFPLLSWITGTSLPIVIVESCSMYHGQSFDRWWSVNSDLYALYNITEGQFETFRFMNGLNKGDIILLWGAPSYHLGEVIVFNANSELSQSYPIIHRVVHEHPIATKGDNNNLQLVNKDGQSNNKAGVDETDISFDRIQGKAIARIPYVGWVKLIFFDWMKPASERGFCQEMTQPKL